MNKYPDSRVRLLGEPEDAAAPPLTRSEQAAVDGIWPALPSGAVALSRSQALSRRQALAGLLGVAAAASASSFSLDAFAGAGLVVIVNPSNRESASSSDLAAIFTTRRQTWKSGARIVPFNYPARNDVRVRFDQAALGMDADAVARYWIDRRIRGGNPPPKQVGNGTLIVRLVARMKGSIGYVPKQLVNSTVRVIAEV